MNSFVAVLPLEPLAVGDGFSLSAWPLHVTVLSNFVSASDFETVARALAAAAEGTAPIVATVAGPALFGRGENIPVSLLTPSPALNELHRRLVVGAGETGVIFENPDFLGDGFRPHVTVTKRARSVEGDLLDLAQLALVDMAPAGDTGHRRVVWTCEFH